MKRTFAFLFTLLFLVAFTTTTLAQDDKKEEDKSKLNSGLVSDLKLRSIGPAFMSGRIGDIVVDPTDRAVWYIAVSSGNVWKTENAGITWKPIFERES